MSNTIERVLGQRNATVADLAEASGKSEAAVRKQVKELVEAGKAAVREDKVVELVDKKGNAIALPNPRPLPSVARDENSFDIIEAAGDKGVTVADIQAKLFYPEATTDEERRSWAYITTQRLRAAERITQHRDGSRTPRYTVAGVDLKVEEKADDKAEDAA